MPDVSLLTIALSKDGDGYRAELHAPSQINGVADLRVRGISPHAVEAIQICLAELQAKAADGDEVALRFA
jgi:hypothetical protein